MTRRGKIFLGAGCAGLVLVAAISVVLLYVGLNYLEARLAENTKDIEKAGADHGRAGDQQSCIVEGLNRFRNVKLTDVNGGVETMTFVDACLKTARPTPGFCDGVPSTWEMKDSEEWKSNECTKAGSKQDAAGCRLVFKSKQNFCRPGF